MKHTPKPVPYIQRFPGQYTPAELYGLQWLGEQAKWLDVTVKRRSEREFDLSIEGTFDTDDGYDYTFDAPVKMPGGGERIGCHKKWRGYPKVKPGNFSAWFLLAALRVWWGYGLHKPMHGDWSFTRDAEPEVLWLEFYRILTLARSKPIFSPTFLRALRAVWQELGGEAQCSDNEDAIETCLDADRLGMLGNGDGAKANAELQWLDTKFGIERITKELAKQVRFV